MTRATRRARRAPARAAALLVTRRRHRTLTAELARNVNEALRHKQWRAPIVRAVVDQFHRIYYLARRQTWMNTYWRGVRVFKCPLDLWVYQEILHEVGPGLIVETGTKYGGSAYYLASLCDLIGNGRIVTIDVEPLSGRPDHPRITYLTGSSTDPDIVGQVDELIDEGTAVIVILDSDHSRDHVLDELNIWHSRVSVGSYLIVEDTNVGGHPVKKSRGPGPWEAIAEWLPRHREFEHDATREKFFLTFNPRGYLKRVA